MSSKKKRRHEEWLKREKKREAEKKRLEALRSGNIEEMAAALNMRLK